MRALVTASFWMLPVGTGLEEPMRLHGGFTSASQVRVLRRARAADLHSPGPSGLLVFRSVGRRAALVSVLWPGQAVGSRGSGSRCRPQHTHSAWLAGPTPQLSKHLPSGRAWSRAVAGPGEARRRGIEAPDLHPEATFPGSFRPHSSSLPWFWSGIRPFQPSPRGCTTQPQAGLLLFRGAKTRQNPGCRGL